MTDNPEMRDEDTEEQTPESCTPIEEFMEHQRRALEETGKALEALLPEGFRSHSSNAGKEFTEGFRGLIDAAFKELKRAKKHAEKTEEDDDEGGKTSSTGKAKVKIPVD